MDKSSDSAELILGLEITLGEALEAVLGAFLEPKLLAKIMGNRFIGIMMSAGYQAS
jgi:hypothetical protein